MKTAYDIIKAIASSIKTGSLYNVDLNDYKGTGLYEITTNNSHAPTTWAWMLVIGGIGSIQIVFAQTYIYVRTYSGSPLTWSTWRRVGLSTY